METKTTRLDALWNLKHVIMLKETQIFLLAN